MTREKSQVKKNVVVFL